MANFIKHIAALLLIILSIGKLASCARKNSPLIVDDDSNRRNRPAGKFLLSYFKLAISPSCVALDCFGQ